MTRRVWVRRLLVAVCRREGHLNVLNMILGRWRVPLSSCNRARRKVWAVVWIILLVLDGRRRLSLCLDDDLYL